MIKSGTKKVFGEVDLIDCFEINLEEYNNYCLELYVYKRESLPYKRTYAWVVKNPCAYDKTKDYLHSKVAIILVNL